MDKQPLVSIITPSYNQARFLESTIKSVISQRYPNKEYLVIDGDSTDSSLDIIKKYSSHIDWWISEKDTGQAEAINKGLQKANGDIVAWLNSDDVYASDAIQIAVNSLVEDEKVGLVYGDVGAINTRGDLINTISYSEWGLDGLLCFRILGQPSIFIRKKVLDKVGFLDLSYQYLLDHQLWIRIAMYANIKYIPQLLAYARYHAEAKNIASARQFGQEAYRIAEWIKNQDLLEDKYERLHKQIMAGAHRINARYLLDGGEAKQAFKSYIKSLKCHPSTALIEWKRILFSIFASIGLLKTNILNSRW